MFCAKCGQKMMALDVFCSKCGAQKLSGIPTDSHGEKKNSSSRPFTGNFDFSKRWENRSPQEKFEVTLLGGFSVFVLAISLTMMSTSENNPIQTAGSPQQPAPSQVVSTPTSPVVEGSNGSRQKWSGKEQEAIELVKNFHPRQGIVNYATKGGSVQDWYEKEFRVMRLTGDSFSSVTWRARHEHESVYHVTFSFVETGPSWTGKKIEEFHANLQSGLVSVAPDLTPTIIDQKLLTDHTSVKGMQCQFEIDCAHNQP